MPAAQEVPQGQHSPELVIPPDFGEITYFNDSDLPCLREMQTVFEQYDMQDRFAPTLAHSHFPLFEGETVLTRQEGRNTLTYPVQLNSLELAPGQELVVTEVGFTEPWDESRFPISPEGATTRIIDTTGQSSFGRAIGIELDQESQPLQPVTVADLSFLREIRAVLERHEMTDRFGLSLEHPNRHTVAGETFLESSDTVNRILLRQPVYIESLTLAKGDDLPVTSFDLSIELDEETFPPSQSLSIACPVSERGHLDGYSNEEEG